MRQSPNADYCIEIDYQKSSESPSRVFRSMYELIETFQTIDRSLVKAIDSNIETVALLEDIETGSIKAWLATKLQLIPDDAAYNID